MTKVSLHRFVKLPQRFLLSLGLGIGILTIGAIAPPPSMTEAAPNKATTRAVRHFTTLSTTLAPADSQWQSIPEAQSNALTVTLYTPTATCETYVGETQTVAQDKAIAQVVHFLIAEQTPQLLDFELAGYRITPGTKGHTVTIDFRRRSGAARQFISLSICEQRVLFGSLRETLLQNPVLGVDAVQFTEQGRPIEI
ncbi:MAG: hypothetical protein AAF892_03190 [Cyanobacteria bacterium P01_D01_bin.71]